MVRDWKSGRGFALRFWRLRRAPVPDARPRARRLDPPKRAQEELENVLADVRRGLWVPPKKKRRSGGGHLPSRRAETWRGAALRPLRGRSSSAESRAGAQVAETITANARERWALGAPAALLRRLAAGRDRRRGGRRLPHRQGRRSPRPGRGRSSAASPSANDRGQLLRPLAARSINKTIDTLHGSSRSPSNTRARRRRERRGRQASGC